MFLRNQIIVWEDRLLINRSHRWWSEQKVLFVGAWWNASRTKEVKQTTTSAGCVIGWWWWPSYIYHAYKHMCSIRSLVSPCRRRVLLLCCRWYGQDPIVSGDKLGSKKGCDIGFVYPHRTTRNTVVLVWYKEERGKLPTCTRNKLNNIYNKWSACIYIYI